MARPTLAPETVERVRREMASIGKRIVATDGANGLTMRRVANEAGCGLGRIYRVYADRTELVIEIARLDLPKAAELTRALHAAVGLSEIATNVTTYFDETVALPMHAFAREASEDPVLANFVRSEITDAGLSPSSALADYLAAEQAVGRVRPEVDPIGIAAILAAALRDHVLTKAVVVDPAARLARMVDAVCVAIAT
jgi:AcrR family transcriptional regulator